MVRLGCSLLKAFITEVKCSNLNVKGAAIFNPPTNATLLLDVAVSSNGVQFPDIINDLEGVLVVTLPHLGQDEFTRGAVEELHAQASLKIG